MPSFTVEYTQGASGPGAITFTLDAAATSEPASGRLDRVGDRVVSPKMTGTGYPDGVVVECIRTSSDAMRVVVVFFNQFQVGYIQPMTERVIENVPLSFD
jgi:hypothetical protein